MILTNQVALITGAASGIGKAIAQTFASNGAAVIIADLNFEAANQVAQQIKQTGAKALAVAMDVSDEQQVNAGVDAAVNQWGRLDILVSNAGIQHIEPIHELSLVNWRKMLAIHLDGAFLTTKACLKYMYPQRRGSIIYIGSAHSKEASKLKAPYVTAKHGVMGLCRVVAKEAAAYNVRANVICPGFVQTPLVDKQIPEQARELGISEQEVITKVLLGNTVDGQFTSYDDVAQASLFFAAFNSNALTGQSLIVSHGWVME